MKFDVEACRRRHRRRSAHPLATCWPCSNAPTHLECRKI
jgi:hypothetical protein